MGYRMCVAVGCLVWSLPLWGVPSRCEVAQEPRSFLTRYKEAKLPAEGAEWKQFKEAREKFTVLLPSAFRMRNAPDEETDTVLYCIAGGSLNDYRLFRAVINKRAVPEPEENALGSFAKEYEQEAAKRLRNPVVIEKGIVDAGKNKAFLLVLEADSPGGFHVTQVVLVNRSGEERCEVQLSCLHSNFERFADVFAQILASFKVK